MNEKLIKNIRDLMEAHGHNTVILSELSGVSQGTISKILKGISSDPRGDTIKKLGSVYSLNESQMKGDMPFILSTNKPKTKKELDREYLSDIVNKGDYADIQRLKSHYEFILFTKQKEKAEVDTEPNDDRFISNT